MTEHTAEAKSKPKPPPPAPTPPLYGPKDVFVNGYERVVDGHLEEVRSYWRRAKADTNPMTKKKQAELIKELQNQSKRLQQDEEDVNKKLESDKAAAESAHGAEKDRLETEIKALESKSTELTEAVNATNNRVREVQGYTPKH